MDSHPGRVLFVAEAVTLAHVARPLVLAQGLAGSHEVVVACDPRYHRFIDDPRMHRLALDSIDSRRFLQALARGSPVYDLPTLRRYVADDLELIRRVAPDLIVGDFRLSLSVSARLAGVRYAAISNAYWSPYQRIDAFPLPVLPMTRFMPITAARAIFRAARPAAFAMHCRPLNRVRREHGLPALGSDLRRVYTDADHVLYADAPAMFVMERLPANHHFIGPILWAPPVPAPAWWTELPADKPIVYLTMGSSGSVRLTEMVLDALADEPVTVVASTAGAAMQRRSGGNIFVADYLPGNDAAARARLVVCNGGSPTSQQALAAGVPVLGIAGNMDQFLNMQAVAAAGAGTMLRADRTEPRRIRETVRAMLGNAALARGARTLAAAFAAHDAKASVAALAEEWTAR